MAAAPSPPSSTQSSSTQSNPNQPASNPWLIAIAVMLATFMEVLDTSIAAVALPYIAGSLSATQRRSHLGADQLPGGERRNPAGKRLVLVALRP